CAISSALGLSVQAHVLDFSEAYDRYMGVNAFYGTNNKNMPYQSVYVNRTVVRPGRRDDIYDRLGMLPSELLKQKSVLDVGCNIGMNAIGAIKSGASRVVGLEVSLEMANYATRFAIFDDCYKDVEFREFNVDEEILPASEMYDVAFMLSVHNHLQRPEALAKIAKNHVEHAVVFECHPDTELEDYKDFIDAGGFSKKEKISVLGTSVFDRSPTRPLWILYK
ncbi:class I SAM-dependent methyltransferase, partial [Draconibacterium sp.]|nr:class I SAM-dependent methyltransferase [Draconibacterium sp.]